MTFAAKPLTTATWGDVARLAEAHRGVWGGCWCMGFRPKGPGRGVSADLNRSGKEALVREGHAQAAPVYDGGDSVGWCQFGSPADLPRIRILAAYRESQAPLPDWRVTCFFAGKGHRGIGVAAAALRGALSEIAQLGGGMAEGYPEDTAGRKVSGSFLFNGTPDMFKAEGFARTRQIGKYKWVVLRRVAAFP